MPIKFTKEHFRWKNGRGHDQKPLILHHKRNNLGLGKKEHDADHWWAKAFDSQLKNLDVSTKKTDGAITVKQTGLNTLQTLGAAHARQIRIHFVRGEVLEGTLSEKSSVTGTPVESETEGVKKEKRKKAGTKEKVGKAGTKEKKVGKAGKAAMKDKSGGKAVTKDKSANAGETKTERKERREKKERKRLRRLVDKELAALVEVKS